MTRPHVDADQAAAYAQGGVDEAAAWGLEAHLETCSTCARRVSAACTDPALRRVRTSVLSATRPPSRAPLRLSLTPALRPGWLLSVAGVVLATFVLDLVGATRLPVVLLIAPLLPLGGIAMSTSPAWDGSAELTASTPTSALRLLLLRSASVLALSVLPLLAVSTLTDTQALPWLLPSAALVALSLALSGWMRVEVATGLSAAVWAAVAVGPSALSTAVPAALSPAAAPVWASVAVAAMVLLTARRASYDRPGVLP